MNEALSNVASEIKCFSYVTDFDNEMVKKEENLKT